MRFPPPSPNASVLLVCMPWASVAQPSLALGLLKAQLAEAGIPSDSVYLNFEFADIIGLDMYEATKNRNVMASEWIFAEGLTERAPADGYLAYLACKGAQPEEIELWRFLRGASVEYFERCINAVDWSHYRIVCFTTSMMQTAASLHMARLVKARHSEVMTVFGGATCEGSMGQALHKLFAQIDVLVRGEADSVVRSLIDRMLDGQPLDNLSGLCFRKDGEQVVTPETPPFYDLISNPVPDYDDYFEQVRNAPFCNRLNIMLMFESSRGCWWGEKSPCRFCALNGERVAFRSKPVSRIFTEIDALHQRYGISNFGAADNILDRLAPIALSEFLERELPGVSVFYDVRANLQRDEMQVMVSGGIAELEAGLESLLTSVLKLIGKGTTGIRNIMFLRRSAEFGIRPLWNFLYGFPGERVEEYEEVLAFANPGLHHLPAPDVAFPLSLQRFSPYFRDPDAHNIEISGPIEDYTYIYGLEASEIESLAYYFQFKYLDKYDPMPTGRLVSEAVRHWQQAQRSGHVVLEARLEGQSVVIYDTRSGEPWKYRLDPISGLLYRMCEAPATMDSLARGLMRVAPASYLRLRGNIKAVVGEMACRGILFHERGQFLALAVPRTANFWMENPGRRASNQHGTFPAA